MRRLISADMNRILRKILLLAGFILAAAILILSVLIFQYVYGADASIFTYSVCLVLPGTELLFSVITFLCVYGDELRSMAMTSAIGRGLTREKVIFAKFLDTVIISALMNAALTLVIVVLQLIYGPEIDHTQMIMIYCSVFTVFYRTIGYVALAALFLFISWNIPFSTIALATISILIPGALLLFKDTGLITTYHIDRYFLSTIGDMALTDLVLGLTKEAILLYLKGFLLYTVLSMIITILVFKKKELEF